MLYHCPPFPMANYFFFMFNYVLIIRNIKIMKIIQTYNTNKSIKSLDTRQCCQHSGPSVCSPSCIVCSDESGLNLLCNLFHIKKHKSVVMVLKQPSKDLQLCYYNLNLCLFIHTTKLNKHMLWWYLIFKLASAQPSPVAQPDPLGWADIICPGIYIPAYLLASEINVGFMVEAYQRGPFV